MGADLPYLQLPSTDCECVECERRRSRDGVIGRRKVVFGRGWLRLLATFHLLSLFVFACCICSTRSLSSTTTISSTTQSSTTSTDKDVYLEEEHVSLDSTSSSQVDNPLLRHQRKTPQEQCHIWNSNTPADLCARGRWARLRLMRDLSLFSRDCTSELSNVRLAELFRLEWRYIKSEVDLLSQTEQLKPQGRDCVLGAPQSSQCLACFGRIGNSLQQLDRAYKAFDRTLQRFDCMLAVDSSSATRPFSPNGTCLDCKWIQRNPRLVWCRINIAVSESEYDGEGENPLENHISDVGEEDRYICDKLMIDLAKNDYPCSVNDKLSTKWRCKWCKATCIKCSLNPKGKNTSRSYLMKEDHMTIRNAIGAGHHTTRSSACLKYRPSIRGEELRRSCHSQAQRCPGRGILPRAQENAEAKQTHTFFSRLFNDILVVTFE